MQFCKIRRFIPLRYFRLHRPDIKGTILSQIIYAVRERVESNNKLETGIILFDEFDKLAYGRTR